MFGLENTKKKSEEFLFDLELDLKVAQKRNALKKKVESRIQEVKTTLRGGIDKKEYDLLGVVLHGYVAVQKVFSRVPTK